MFVRIDSKYIVDNKLLDMCKTADQNDDPTAENIGFLDWWDRPETLMHQIFKQKAYDDGGYYVYEEDGVYLGGMGYYPFEEDKNIFVCPVRLYVIPDLGIKKSMEVIQRLVGHVMGLARNNFRAMVFFVNEHNRWRLKSLKNASNPKMNPYVPFPNQEMVVYDKIVRYKYTVQTAIYMDYDNYENEVLECLRKIII
jgi:hypothetical protein